MGNKLKLPCFDGFIVRLKLIDLIKILFWISNCIVSELFKHFVWNIFLFVPTNLAIY